MGIRTYSGTEGSRIVVPESMNYCAPVLTPDALADLRCSKLTHIKVINVHLKMSAAINFFVWINNAIENTKWEIF